MAGAAKIAIMSRVAVQQFVGYCLWSAARRTRSKQQWKDSTKTYGRTDTPAQAWGCIAELVNDLQIESIREDSMFFSWKTGREAIKQPGEAYRQEGSIVWNKNLFGRRHELGQHGALFYQRLKRDELDRQRANQERERAYHQPFFAVPNLPCQYLKVLGLDVGVRDMSAIKTAYRKLVAVHHPDRGGDQNKFVQVRQAYEQLLTCF